jgi:cobalt-zinc-cadmium resistance protein CzcA
MLNRLIDFTLSHRWMAILFLIILVVVGAYMVQTIPVDAFPDLTNNQVVVITDAPAMPPVEVEQLVTRPIELGLLGIPKELEVRSISKLGLSMVTIVFEDSVPTYFARQLVNERLQQVSPQLPAAVQPVIGPPSTAFGELFQYTLQGSVSSMQLKEVQEWQIKNQLRTVPGVSEINTWGGDSKQFQIKVDPVLLQQYGLTLHDVMNRVADNNLNFGGGFIEHASEQYTMRGTGRATTAEELGDIVVLANQGAPVLLRDIAEVTVGAAPRQGAVLRNGETVSGMVIMLKGENGKRVIERVKRKIADLRLPEGVRLTPFYDQSTVIDGTLETVVHNLLEGFVLVTVVLLVFLGNIRAALLTASIIPFSMLISFLGMRFFGISANLMSLGAIDFGMIVDGAIVMMENSIHRLENHPEAESTFDSIRLAAREVARPMTFGVAIIIAVYLPLFFLEGLEGRMFRPMAVTVCAALLGSLLLALTVIPTLATYLFRRGIPASEEKREGWFESLHRVYGRLLLRCMAHRPLTIGIAVAALVLSLGSLAFIGTEFMPRLDEASILIETRKLPGISLTDSVEISKRVERILRGFPEIRDVVTKIGRPDFATEAMGINEGDVYVLLRPYKEWKRFPTKDELIEALDRELAKVPGISYDFTQPMAMRLDETVSGVKADLAVKIFGDDFKQLEPLAQQVLRQVASVPGAANTQLEVSSGVAELSVKVDRAALARYALNVSDVQAAVEAVAGGSIVSRIIDGQKQYTVALRLPDRYRADLDAVRAINLRAPGGEQVTLGQVADIRVMRGPERISHEDGQRRMVVMSYVRGRDLGSFVNEVRSRIAQNVKLPPGYRLTYGGQFENQERATRRLMLVIPFTISIIGALLHVTFQSAKQAMLVLFNVPFALVGGIAALWTRGMNLNLSASVGFIALFGVAVLNGVVLISSVNQWRAEGLPSTQAVYEGARRRLRPVLMTALVATLGFVPMAISHSIGAEVQRPLATVVIGGLFSSTILTLLLLPVLYDWLCGKDEIAATVVEAGGPPELVTSH